MRAFTCLLVFIFGSTLWAQEAKVAPKKLDRVAIVKQLQEAYRSQCMQFVEAIHRQESPADKEKLLVYAPTPAQMFKILTKYVKDDPTDEAAFDGLSWSLRYLNQPEVAKEITFDPMSLLAQHHLKNPKLLDLCKTLPGSTPQLGSLLRSLYEEGDTEETKAIGGYLLAKSLISNLDKASKLEIEKANKEAETILEKIVDNDKLATVKLNVRSLLHTEAATELKDLRVLGIGKPLPEVSGENLEGKQTKITDYRGKIVVIDVWATWCGPCRAMIPHEREMVKRFEGRPFTLVSVSCDAKKETLTDFLDKNSMPWTHWWVGRGEDFSKELNIRFFPTIFVLDAQGVIRFKNIRGEKLEEAVNHLLKEMTANP